VRQESLRADVVAAALSLFAEQGYRATTMSDIGAAVGLRGPSLYRHIRSKQQLLVAIMTSTMDELLTAQGAAIAAGGDPAQVMRRMVEAHVRFHAGNREQAFVGNREIDSLEPDSRSNILRLRRKYEHRLRKVISDGVKSAIFATTSPRLASYAILDMGIGVSTWFHDNGPHSVDEVSYTHANLALAMLGSRSDLPNEPA
jgi:AcrR family transcriptional regulator